MSVCLSQCFRVRMSHPDSPCTYKTPMLSALQDETLTFCRKPHPHLPWIQAEGRKTWWIWKCKNQVLPSARIKVKMEQAVVKWEQGNTLHLEYGGADFPVSQTPACSWPVPLPAWEPREEVSWRGGNWGFAISKRINKRWMVSAQSVLSLRYYVPRAPGERHCNSLSEL